MKKILLILVLLFTSNLLYAVEIKLSCDVNITLSYPSGSGENRKIHEIYQIRETSSGTSIIPNSNTGLLPFVATFGAENINVIDNSDQNKWDIWNTRNINGNSYILSVIIDRNSGQIFTSTLILSKNNKGSTLFEGIGSCQKVDTSKKKF